MDLQATFTNESALHQLSPRQCENYVLIKLPVALLPVAILLASVGGCSKSALPVVPVHGKVMFDGGHPPKPGSITFTPIKVAEGLPNRPGTADFGENGEFRVTSFRENDGLVPGTYHAAIECWMRNPYASDPTTFERFNYVPKDYQPPVVSVSADAGQVEVNFEVPSKKK